MAEVTVKVKLEKEVTIYCDGTDQETAMDDIRSECRLDEECMDDLYNSMTFISGVFDEESEETPIEDDDEDDEEEEDSEES